MLNTSIKYSVLALSSALTQAAYANDIPDIERVTVYGALSTTPLSEMPSSIDVISQLAIEQRHAQHLDEILNKAGNVNFATGASRGRFVQIRGIGERSQFVDPVNPSVGFLVDGINYSGMLAGASTFDVAQIEIFKGPNSARFGADGLAGMINVISTPTASQQTLNLQVGLANYNSWSIGAAAGGGWSDSVYYRFSVHQNSSDGFIENAFLARSDTNNQDELTARGKIDWQVNEDLSLNTTVHIIDVDNGYDAFSLDRNRQTLSDQPGFDRQQSEAIALSANYSGLSWANMQWQVTFLQADLGYAYDEDWSYVGIAPDWEYSSTDQYLRDRQDLSVQGKWLSKSDATNRWVMGIYVASRDEDLDRAYFDFDAYQDALFASSVQREDMALFAQYRLALTQSQWLEGSLRLASQDFAYQDSANTDSQLSHNDWGAELSYQQQISAASRLYFSVLRSYKMGGVNGQALSKLDDPGLAEFRQILLDNSEFSPESLLGTEFGIKGANPQGSISLDFSVFYQWRDNVQYKNSIVRDQSFVDFYNNAASGRNYGAEFNLQAMLGDNVDVFVNLGWLKTRIAGITRQDGSMIDNREQAHAPNYQVNLGFSWQLNEHVSYMLEVDAKDEFYYSFNHDQRSDQQTIVHTNLDYVVDNWTLSLYVRNLFDQTYANRGFFFGNDPRDEYAPHTYEQFGEPRRVGVTLQYEF